jgi:hypothetical protein
MSYIGNIPTTASFPFDQFSGTGSQVAFTLSYAPASTSSIIVSVSGVNQSPNTYTVVGTTLTFTGAPPSGASNITVLFLGLPVITNTPINGKVPFFDYLSVANNISLTSDYKVPFYTYTGATNNISLTI